MRILRKYLPDSVYQPFFDGEATTTREAEGIELTVLFCGQADGPQGEGFIWAQAACP